MKLWANKQAGFTIVELLIVIVVIAILASITIVTYSGVTTRAENAKTLDAVGKYVDALVVYASSNAGYPITSSVSPCLGLPGDGKCGNITNATSDSCGGAGTTDATFNTTIKASLGNTLPEPSSQVLSCGGRQYKAAYYKALVATSATITYYLRGNQSCDTIKDFASATKYQAGDTTVCIGTLSY